MAIDTTTIKGITDGIVSQMEQSLNTSFPLMPKSFTRVLAKAIASSFIMQTQYKNFIQLQQYVSTCSAENIKVLGYNINPLQFWGDLIGVTARGEGERAVHNVTVSVSQTTGVLDAGTQLISAINGYTYITSQAYNITAPSMTISVKAANDEANNSGIGASGNLDTGDVISFVNPPAVVSKDAVIAGQTTTGADAETTASYRNRVIIAFKRRKQGGSKIDYKSWGEEVDGITNVYPYTGLPGEMDIYSEATVASSGSSDGIPTPSQLLAVSNSIEYDVNGIASRKPAGTFVNSYAITRKGFTVTVNGLNVIDVAGTQAEITQALTDFFAAAEPFIDGLSIPPRSDSISTIEIESVIISIVKANNGSFTSADLFDEQTGDPVTAYQLNDGEKAKISGVTFA